MKHQGPLTAARLALCGALVGIAACGGVTKFEDTTPIVLGSPVPPPAPQPKRVQVTAERIEIDEKILFETDEAVILAESHGLLNEVVEAMNEHPQIKKIDIVGHTDSEGKPEYNQSLSERRAKAVLDYLVGKGIAAGRLVSHGKGEAAPLASNETEEGREKNRRVEFVIVEQGEVK